MKKNNPFITVMLLLFSFLIVALSGCSTQSERLVVVQEEDTEEVSNVRRIAIDAYIYAYPMLEYYESMYFQNIDSHSKQFQAGFNKPFYANSLAQPSSKKFVNFQNDSLQTFTRYDLRNEPMVWSVPDMGKRYYSIQFVDMFSHNFAYLGTRTTGNQAGNYLLVGPHWQGKVPEGINKVIRSESNFPYTIQRTAVLPDEIVLAEQLVKQFKLLPLHQFTGSAAPKAMPAIEFPVYERRKAESIDFIEYFNFLLGQVSVPARENELFDKFSEIGIGSGLNYNRSSYNKAQTIMIKAGVAKAINDIKVNSRNLVTTKKGWQVFTDIYGNREKMQDRYLTRAAAARFALYGNDVEEVYNSVTSSDSEGLILDGEGKGYTLYFPKENLPPVDAYWSLTIKKLPEQSLVANQVNRYAINSSAGDLQYADDGSLTVYIQQQSPGTVKQANWLPAPTGKFILQFRAYNPKLEALKPETLWVPPMVQATE